MATKRIPTHPGKFIQRVYLDELDISASDLANALEINKATLSRLLNEKADLSPTLALKLSEVLGRSPQSWMNMQANHSLAKIEAELKFSPQVVLKNGVFTAKRKRKSAASTRTPRATKCWTRPSLRRWPRVLAFNPRVWLTCRKPAVL